MEWSDYFSSWTGRERKISNDFIQFDGALKQISRTMLMYLIFFGNLGSSMDVHLMAINKKCKSNAKSFENYSKGQEAMASWIHGRLHAKIKFYGI